MTAALTLARHLLVRLRDHLESHALSLTPASLRVLRKLARIGPVMTSILVVVVGLASPSWPLRHPPEATSSYPHRMGLMAKLQIRPGQRLTVLAGCGEAPTMDTEDVVTVDRPEEADAIVVFVRGRADLDTLALPAIERARRDELSWIAYPKAGQLGTDLNRDTLSGALTAWGIRPVRQIAIDETWSALRFRPV